MNTTMPIEGFFATRLRELRHEAGLTQAVLAERAGLTVNGVQQFESGRREPSYETLVRIAEGLGVSLAAFDQPGGKPKKGK